MHQYFQHRFHQIALAGGQSSTIAVIRQVVPEMIIMEVVLEMILMVVVPVCISVTESTKGCSR